jgi:hypothetical protein
MRHLAMVLAVGFGIGLASCASSDGVTNGDGGGPGDGPSGSEGDGSASVDDAGMSIVFDLFGAMPGTFYDDLGRSDSGICMPGVTGPSCLSPVAINAGCGAIELCGANGMGNGLDDNCDGKVDETCTCVPGAVERCFLGPPGKRGVGACTDGTQTCYGSEFGTWGSCVGSIGPAAEVCDNLDNDCNGCPDDELCCDALLACPSSVPDAAPYTDVSYDGSNYFKDTTMSWSWTVVGGPCDQLFSTTTGSPAVQSYTVTGSTTATPKIHFTLSGDYTITMTAVDAMGASHSCKWVQHVVGPGVRFELCWDHTGTVKQGGADLDLHVHRPGANTDWFMAAGTTYPTPNDCNFSNCNPDIFACTPKPNLPCPIKASIAWGFGASPLAQCQGAPPTQLGNSWSSVNAMCPNPRLDIDSINIVGRPENANIDAPANGETFRAMVHYYGQDAMQSKQPVEEHPIVNVYCGGLLKATYGQAPNTLGPCPGPTCFDQGSGWAAGLMWRVADVTATVDAMGNTVDCTVKPIHPPGQTSGYYVTTDDTTF